MLALVVMAKNCKRAGLCLELQTMARALEVFGDVGSDVVERAVIEGVDGIGDEANSGVELLAQAVSEGEKWRQRKRDKGKRRWSERWK